MDRAEVTESPAPAGERRGGERRRAGRRRDDHARARAAAVAATIWAVAGAAIVLYLFFVAIGGIDPSEALPVTIAVLVLAILWIAHAWRRLVRGGHVSHGDRERRGF